MHVLLTGGAGYIGSHTAVALLAAGHSVSIVDNLSNSSIEAVRRVERLSGRQLAFHDADLLDIVTLKSIVSTGNFDAVIHFAGLKAVGESVGQPLQYYRTNLVSTLNLLEVMAEQEVERLIFSSSATVYGNTDHVPMDEHCPVTDATSPYGRTKLFLERIIEDACVANPKLHATSLRYFNPVGAHASGQIGEDPEGPPNNLLPYITQVAVGRREQLTVFGNDYPTPDGTCIRDYIHVSDLAMGHVAALELTNRDAPAAINLGTGTGHSVLEVIAAFESATGIEINWTFGPRRAGDIAQSYTDASLAESTLGWKATHSLEDICLDAWRWQQQNPAGYRGN